ncbi:GNAT family N-acetyltransferase [Croceivirga thetidis]|uniref:GNAT family N-acetyltransferase n=1 Tax=Croceivirga thetidis TaxID=2721623 RepID=A0ABX1GTA6_9FLAO|nr:GNAT family N-acetyltransferase [Croceivirga thetidis]NKI32241.1 GNAT family N-acetyltransferase [Croceivirga thetidis]
MSVQEVFVSTDPLKIDLNFVHQYLSEEAYWSKGRTIEEVKTSIENSLCFGLYLVDGDKQIGFARVATDYIVFAWLMDVFIDAKFKGQGYGKSLVQHIVDHPKLSNVNGFGLRTSDAHGLYHQFGFTEIPDPETWMFKKNKL